jgi:hypothetical protein
MILPKPKSATSSKPGCVNCGLDIISPGITKTDILNSPSYQLIMGDQLMSTLHPNKPPWYNLELWISELFWSDDASKWKCLKFDKERKRWYYDNRYELDARPVVVKYQVSELDGMKISSGSLIIQNMTKVQSDTEHGLDATGKFPIRVPTDRRVKIDIWIILPCGVCCNIDIEHSQPGKKRTIHREFTFNYDDYVIEEERKKFGIWVIERSVVHDYDDMGCIDDHNCPMPETKIPDPIE